MAAGERRLYCAGVVAAVMQPAADATTAMALCAGRCGMHVCALVRLCMKQWYSLGM